METLETIFSILFSIFYVGFMLFVFALAMFPRFRAKYQEWKRKWSPKLLSAFRSIAKPLEDMVILAYESFLSPILFVLALAFLVEQIHPIITSTHDWNTLASSLERDIEMNIVFYYVLMLAIFLWFVGFFVKKAQDDDRKKAEDKWREADIEWKQKMSLSLERIVKHLDLIEKGGENERENNKP